VADGLEKDRGIAGQAFDDQSEKGDEKRHELRRG
jgi:hypothetical protein